MWVLALFFCVSRLLKTPMLGSLACELLLQFSVFEASQWPMLGCLASKLHQAFLYLYLLIMLVPMFGILGSEWLLYLLSYRPANLSVLISLGGEPCYASLCFDAMIHVPFQLVSDYYACCISSILIMLMSHFLVCGWLSCLGMYQVAEDALDTLVCEQLLCLLSFKAVNISYFFWFHRGGVAAVFC